MDVRLENWIDITLSQKDILDYEEFCSACHNNNILHYGLGDWAQRIGILLVARHRLPDIPVKDAYLKIINSFTENAPSDEDVKKAHTIQKSCCGGGQVK